MFRVSRYECREQISKKKIRPSLLPDLFCPVRKDSIKYFTLVRTCPNLFALFLNNYEITGIGKWGRVSIRLYKICPMCPILMHDTTGVDITQSLTLQPDLFTEVGGCNVNDSIE
jgi:hypothetical protein